ncbi:MAG TPA: succinate dehydrogenase, hydrophobic membrane anchor protein [Xanthobacteraceae bacterium]|jgi:succinate dehydrogenase / fumarate reductase membrane anchor subunit|nr:succinate dehydrogenase, hydrophobic membrane anchor protein [Xanthobacteraceae bacterium]
MRTPLSKVRGLGAAHSGTGHFWLQRLTAVANVPLVIAFLIVVVSLVGRGHAAVIGKLANPLVAVIILAALISILTHMRIGMQVIIEDYVHSEGRKVIAVMANTLFTFAIGLVAVYALLKINFGL